MKKIRTKLITFLVVCMSFLVLLGCYGCATNAKFLKFTTSSITYRVGDNIDAFELVEKETGVQYDFAYQKEGEEKVSFKGRTFCVASSGNYTLYVDAQKGDQKQSGSTTFKVLDVKPTVSAASSALTFDLYQELNIWALMAMNGVAVNSSTEYNSIVDYVTYYANDSYVDGEVIDIYDSTKGMEEFDLSAYRKIKIKFDREGIYVFHLYVENAGGRSEGQFKVFCVEDLSKLELVTDNNITFNTKTYQASWEAIEGASEYKVKIGTSAFYTKELTLDMTDSIYKEFMYFDLVVLPLDENGDKIGKKLILNDVVVAPEGFEGIVLSDGAKIDKETDSVNLKGDLVTNGNITFWYEFENSYIAFSGDYGVGTYVEATFTGNNLPYVCFFSNDISGNMTNSEGGTGLLLMNGIGTETYRDRFRVYGMERLGESYWDSSSKMIRSMDTYSKEISQDILNTNLGTEYKYVVGTFENAAGMMTLDVQLFAKNAKGEWINVWGVVESTFIPADEVVPGNIIMWAGVKGVEQDTAFSFVRPYEKEITDEMRNETLAFGRKNADGSITLEAAPLNPNGGYGSISAAKNGHLGFYGNYGVGTYVETTFTTSTEDISNLPTDFGCANLPQIILFADSTSGGVTSDWGKGILLSSGIAYWDTNSYRNSNTSFSVFGLDRLNSQVDTRMSISTFPLLTQMGLRSVPQGDTYKYIVGSFYNLDGELCLDITLLKQANGEWVELFNDEGVDYTNIILNTKWTEADLEAAGLGTNIIIMAENKAQVWKPTTTFKLLGIESKDAHPANPTPEYVPPYVAGGASFNNDGTVTLSGVGFFGGSNQQLWNAQFGYIGYNGNYGIGTTLEFEFMGKNLPDVIFFASGVNGYKSSYGGSGLLLTAGCAPCNPNSVNNPSADISTDGETSDFRVYNGRIAQNTSYDWFDTDGYDGYTGNLNATLYGTTGGSTYADYPLLTQAGLKQDTSGDSYKYVVTTKLNAEDKVVVVISLYKKSGDAWVDIDNGKGATYTNLEIVTTLTKADIKGTNVLIQAPGFAGEWIGSVTFSYKLTKGEELEVIDYVSENATFNEDGSVTLAGVGFFGGSNQKLWDAKFGYIGFNGNYGIGTTLEFEFTGLNIPDVILFAPAVNGYKSSYGGGGLLLTAGCGPCNSNGPSADVSIDGETSDFRVYNGRIAQDTSYDWFDTDGYDGYTGNLIATLYGATGGSTYADYPLLTQAGLKGSTDTYKYVVTTKLNAENKIVVVISLYKKSGNTWVDIENGKGATYTNLEIVTNLTEADIKGTNIIVQSTGVTDSWQIACTFKYNVITAKKEG